MRRSTFVLAVAVAATSFLTTAVQAHEGHAHKMAGTVTAVHADMNHVELEMTDGRVSGFYVTPTTKYLKGAKAATLSDLTAGTRVVVTATTEGDKMVASEVKVGATSKAAAAPASPHHH
jgi:hypothetical protein